MTERISQASYIDALNGRLSRRTFLKKMLQITGVASVATAAGELVELGQRTQQIADIRTELAAQSPIPRTDPHIVAQHVATATAFAHDHPNIPAQTAIPESLAVIRADQAVEKAENETIAKKGLKGKFDRALNVSLLAIGAAVGSAFGFFTNEVVAKKIETVRDTHMSDTSEFVTQEEIVADKEAIRLFS